MEAFAHRRQAPTTRRSVVDETRLTERFGAGDMSGGLALGFSMRAAAGMCEAGAWARFGGWRWCLMCTATRSRSMLSSWTSRLRPTWTRSRRLVTWLLSDPIPSVSSNVSTAFPLAGSWPATRSATCAPASVRSDPETAVSRPHLPGLIAGFSWTAGRLHESGWFDWLTSLPASLRGVLATGDRLVGVHATPDRDDGSGLHAGLSDDELEKVLDLADADILCAGHTHVPLHDVSVDVPL